VLFAILGVAGVAIGAGGRPDGWFPFLGVPVVMVAASGSLGWKTRCPRCEHRLLVGRRQLPERCPSCAVRLIKDPGADPGAASAAETSASPAPEEP
jgi:DNA-directed RNA polymerase subunit RPC12/RpoP